MALEDSFDRLFQTPGRCWTAAEKDAVLKWLQEPRLSIAEREPCTSMAEQLLTYCCSRDTDPHLKGQTLDDFFLRAMRLFEKYDPLKGNFRSWVAKILTNNYQVARQRQRHRHSIRRHREAEAARGKPVERACQPAPEADLTTDSLAKLRPLFDKLSSKEREAIELRLTVNDPSHKNMARAAGCKELTMRVRFCRAIQKLRKLSGQGLASARPCNAPDLLMDYVPQHITNKSVFDDLWMMDRNAYPLIDGQEYAESMYEILRGWWEAFPRGLIGLYRNGLLIGGLGAWPITSETADQLRAGQLRERDLEPWPGDAKKIYHVYIGGILLALGFRGSMAVRYLVRDCFGLFFREVGPEIGYPLEILAQAASEPGEKMLERFEFHACRAPEDMPDKLRLYRLETGRQKLLERLVMLG